MDESNAIPGWHPQEDGRERWWDGTQWTDHYREAPTAAAAVAQTRQQKQLADVRSRFKPWMGYVATGFVCLMLGIAMGGSDSSKAEAAGPAPTVTVHSTSTTTTTAAPEVTEEPAAVPEPVAPAALRAKDFKIGVKTLTKQCFGSAGCNVTYRIKPEYIGKGALPEGTIEITYTVKGAEDPIINTFTIEDGEASFDSSEMASTSSSSKKLSAVATDVSVQ